MTITEARKSLAGTGGLSTASQVVNGTPGSRIAVGSLATNVRRGSRRHAPNIHLEPMFEPTEKIVLNPTRRRRKQQDKAKKRYRKG